MLSIKTPLALIVSVVLAVLGFLLFTTVLKDLSVSFSAFMFSAGVIVYTALALLLSKLTNASAIETQTATKRSPARASVNSDASGLTTLYVGNLPYKANEGDVQTHFEKFGSVSSVRLMKDKRTGKRKGFGFVEVEGHGSDKMIDALNDSTFQERTIKVRPAKDKVES